MIAGQGTIGLELLEDLPALDAVLVPLSGGGLIGGIALALKSAARSIRVIGVSMERGPAMVAEPARRAAGRGRGGGEPRRFPGRRHRPRQPLHLRAGARLVDETVLVSEDEIAAAMAHCYWQEQQIVEGGAAVGVAALLAGKVEAPAAASRWS